MGSPFFQSGSILEEAEFGLGTLVRVGLSCSSMQRIRFGGLLLVLGPVGLGVTGALGLATLGACSSKDETIGSSGSDSDAGDNGAGDNGADDETDDETDDGTGNTDTPPSMTASGGTGGMGPAPSVQPTGSSTVAPPVVGNTAGGTCEVDADCISGMFCLLEDNEFFSYRDTPGRVAGGFCTARCENDQELCSQFGELSLCITDPGESMEDMSDDVGYCMEYCEISDGRQKCASADQFCLPFLSNTQGACTPLCLDDVSCGEGSFCDPYDGLCRDDPPEGKAIGEACSAADECAGFCTKVNETDESGICSAPCTVLGVVAGCGVDLESSEPPGALCFPLDPENAGLNDPGTCFTTCDTNDDCNSSSLECFPFTEELVDLVGRAGLCWPTEEALNGTPDGGTSSGSTDGGDMNTSEPDVADASITEPETGEPSAAEAGSPATADAAAGGAGG